MKEIPCKQYIVLPMCITRSKIDCSLLKAYFDSFRYLSDAWAEVDKVLHKCTWLKASEFSDYRKYVRIGPDQYDRSFNHER